eukprot:7391498-Prymnesium_polylepis.3
MRRWPWSENLAARGCSHIALTPPGAPSPGSSTARAYTGGSVARAVPVIEVGQQRTSARCTGGVTLAVAGDGAARTSRVPRCSATSLVSLASLVLGRLTWGLRGPPVSKARGKGWFGSARRRVSLPPK